MLYRILKQIREGFINERTFFGLNKLSKMNSTAVSTAAPAANFVAPVALLLVCPSACGLLAAVATAPFIFFKYIVPQLPDVDGYLG